MPTDNTENSSATTAAIAATTRLDGDEQGHDADAAARDQRAELASEDAAQHRADDRHGDEQEDAPGRIPVEALVSPRRAAGSGAGSASPVMRAHQLVDRRVQAAGEVALAESRRDGSRR